MAKRATSGGGDPVPEDVLDAIYGAPAEEFVARRAAAAKELRAAGDSAAAGAVAKLRKPNVPAAAINRAVRSAPARARSLLDAAGDLRRAHEAVLNRRAGPDAIRTAAAKEREAVDDLAAIATARALGDRAASADVERRIRDTLGAVALDPEVRDRFAAGRLERDARAAGLPFDLAPPDAPPRQRGRAPAAARTQRSRPAAARETGRERRRLTEAVRRAQEAVERGRRGVEKAAAARARADGKLQEARARLREAEAELRDARRAADRRASA